MHILSPVRSLPPSLSPSLSLALCHLFLQRCQTPPSRLKRRLQHTSALQFSCKLVLEVPLRKGACGNMYVCMNVCHWSLELHSGPNPQPSTLNPQPSTLSLEFGIAQWWSLNESDEQINITRKIQNSVSGISFLNFILCII
jgi:hypothetical protein